MSESRLLEIHDEVDVIDARQQTRQMAKDAGLSIMDQARISLAVSSLAHLIRLGECYPGQIVINRIVDGSHSAVQVCWKIEAGLSYETVLQDIHNSMLSSMVHELDASVLPESGVCISAMMWNTRRFGQNRRDGDV
jgi:hypothetical protein